MALEILFTMYRLIHVTASNIRLYSEIVSTVTAFVTKLYRRHLFTIVNHLKKGKKSGRYRNWSAMESRRQC